MGGGWVGAQPGGARRGGASSSGERCQSPTQQRGARPPVAHTASEVPAEVPVARCLTSTRHAGSKTTPAAEVRCPRASGLGPSLPASCRPQTRRPLPSPATHHSQQRPPSGDPGAPCPSRPPAARGGGRGGRAAANGGGPATPGPPAPHCRRPEGCRESSGSAPRPPRCTRRSGGARWRAARLAKEGRRADGRVPRPHGVRLRRARHAGGGRGVLHGDPPRCEREAPQR